MEYKNAKRTAPPADFRYPEGEWGPFGGKWCRLGEPAGSCLVLVVPRPATLRCERVWLYLR
jgi:hypothetical protein